jgi:hypothetical protein
VPVENVVIEVEEKLIVTLKKDGGMESMEIQGTMALEVASEDAAFIRLHIAAGANKGFQVRVPNTTIKHHAWFYCRRVELSLCGNINASA